MSTRYDTGGRDIDGDVYDASFECDDCGLSLSWPVTEGLPAAQDPVAAPMLALIAEHEDGGCTASQLQDERLRQYPKDLYFNAEDLNVGPNALEGSEIDVIRSRRLGDYRRACTLLEDLQYAAKPLKAFDRNGNIGMAAANLMDTALAAHKALRNLVQDIAQAEQRFREQSAVRESPTPPPAPAVIEPSPEASVAAGPPPAAVKPTPQVSTAAGPKPGPHLAQVTVFNPAVSVREQLSAFDRVLDARQHRLASGQ
ncbi:hypothetical protein J7I84_08985 [Arthrobacter sp. ISL-85]|uniref:hypothetical protein n=1 Tax=Arthrobacter sp. ISL-85 TaxID=2819115 RepID=UPI001BE702BD|nr:hypothetical protein [Arthrobacter sp. ISL-85]MBT2566627.1 hypothetical protein [Arthrobacter sp. ISL-85]